MRKYLLNKAEAQTLGIKVASYQTFEAKTPEVQQLINEALHILDHFGIPVEDKTARKLERMALAFLAVCDVKVSADWIKAKSLDDGYALKTRDIIDYINANFAENISRGSYDDIRRKDLKHLVLAGVVISDRPQSARNDPNRAWTVNPAYIELIRAYSQYNWVSLVEKFLEGKATLQEQLAARRDLPRIPIQLPSGIELEFGPGEHNRLQKAVVEEFLPRYGFGAKVVYIGDAENKFLHYDEDTANKIGLATLAHEELPDVVAYSQEKNWLYLIEAVHSSGPMSPERIIALQPFLNNCTTDIIFVTAFVDRATFRKFVADIAWETEVWIASSPNHLIHFDGEKFLGPYQQGLQR
ncbi:MAG: restriction endonuclease [Ardenticatenales bacterium]|nr:restriction endonuclease [Ardenticatenales bacterium]